MLKSNKALIDNAMQLTLDKEEIKDLLEQPDNFGYGNNNEEMFKSWTLGPVLRTRDSGLLELSNALQIEKILEQVTGIFIDSNDYEITSCNHWACGHVDHLSYQVIDKNGNVTAIAKLIKSIYNEIEEYPILNEDSYSELEHEALCENMLTELNRLDLTVDPEECLHDVMDWLESNDRGQLENDSADRGAYPSSESILKACEELELLADDE